MIYVLLIARGWEGGSRLPSTPTALCSGSLMGAGSCVRGARGNLYSLSLGQGLALQIQCNFGKSKWEIACPGGVWLVC